MKKVLRVIKFNQNAWLKPYIDMNIDLRKKAKHDFEKGFFKLMNNAVFRKLWKMLDIKLVATERGRNYLVSEPNYHTTKFFTENLLAIEMKNKNEILMNKPVLELSKILMYEFWYDYVKQKYGEEAKLCYMDADIHSLYR